MSCSNPATCVLVAVLAAVTASSVGCAPAGPKRVAVRGQVNLDGDPISDVSVVFRPQATGQLGATAFVLSGEFAVDESEGPSEGVHDIIVLPQQPDLEEFEGMRAAGRNPLTAPRIHQRYQQPGALTAEVKEGGSNEFVFELTSRRR